MQEQLPITVILATRNEEANMEKCLRALSPVAKILVVDSHSQDATVEIAETYGAEVVPFHYQGGYPKKRQWTLTSLPIGTPWVLLLDADEVVPEGLWREISEKINSSNPCDGYLITKEFHFMGRRFRHGGFSHAAVLLFRNGKARFEHLIDESPTALDMEVHERLIVDGTVGVLRTPLIHEDFKNLEAYIARHNSYSSWEAKVRHQFLITGRWGHEAVNPKLFGNTQERRRFIKKIAVRMPFEPSLWFVYHYFFRLGFLEGYRGLIACRIRASYIAQVRAKLFEIKVGMEP